MSAVPPGFCQCGCGRRAPLADRNERKRGYVKGQPLRYCKGHAAPRDSLRPFTCAKPEERAEALRLYAESTLTIYAIALRTGLSESTIKAAARRAGLSRKRLTWQSANWADRGAVKQWLSDHVAPERLAACGVRGIIDSWHERTRISIWSIDRAFVPLGLHLSQLPGDVWIG